MTKALQEEIEKLESEEATGETVVEETEEVVEESDESGEEPAKDIDEEVADGDEEAAAEQVVEEDPEKKRKQEEYFSRQKKRQEERQKELEAAATNANTKQERDDAKEELDELVKEIRQYKAQQQYTSLLNQAKKELKTYEEEFRQGFTDYDDEVERALGITKNRLLSNGMSEAEAAIYLENEKIMIADRAAAQGKDPVEAVYNEAKAINKWFDDTAKSMGYTKTGKTKTNLQAMRELSKPNAATGGKGKGANATRKTLDSIDDLEDANMTIAEYRELMAQ